MFDTVYSIAILDYYGKERAQEGEGKSYGFVCLFVCLKYEDFCNQTMYFLCLNMKTCFSTSSTLSLLEIKANFLFLPACLHSPKSEPSFPLFTWF